jgi:drug/metabolite transporter (DMT)-like permease
MTTPTPQSANPQMLHRFLGIGVAILAAVFIGMTVLGAAPLLAGDESAAVIGYGMCAVGLTAAAVAVLVFKPRIPGRRPGQSVDQYWSDLEAVSKIMPFWFLLEGAVVLSCIAFLMAGGAVASATMGITMVAYFLNGPEQLVK